MRAEDAAPVVAAAIGERRHMTVLFCDLVNSTSIAAQLDPEEWREVVASYHRAATEAITQFGGYVAQYLGDGVMAYFGFPEAHENNAERAVRAGLAIFEAISKLNVQPTPPKLSARVGIDSGVVVVGASAGKNADVFGDTPNIAARVQAAAEPGTVVITDATHRLVSGLFVVDQLGPQALKGIELPVLLYRVIQLSGVRGRLEAAAATRGLTPFVGREDELRLLMNRWERALDGEGQVVLIIGEAGIGKSRLLQRFHEQIVGTPHTWVEAGAGAFFQNTPFYPVSELFQQFLGGNGGKPAEEQLAQLEPRLELAGLKPAEAIPLIAPLLNLPLSDKYPLLPLSPEQRRRRLLATLVEWVLGAARVQPLVVATQDLHWADASTLELIQLLVEQGATARLLLLYTARPEFRAQWLPRAHYTQITLNRLSARNVRAMVGQVAAPKALSDETVAAVVERTGGVPLFVEELTRVVLETGNEKLIGREIPVTLHDSLMARLDRLGLAKEVAQVGAVIGAEFSYELIRAVHPIAGKDLEEALRTMADAELLYVRGVAPEAFYQFKHALIRDAAYEALLKSRRKELHRQVARTIEEKFPALNLAHPEVLARHWTEAGETEHAIAGWERASKAAETRGGLEEVLESYQRALAMLSLIPEEAKRFARDASIKPAAAQLELAHEYGYRTWAELIVAVRRMASAKEAPSGDNASRLPDSPSSDEGSSNVFPFLPLRGLVTFPHVSYPIFIGRHPSMNAIRRAKEKDIPIVLVAQKDPTTSNPSSDDMYEVGTLASVVELASLPDGRIRSVIETKRRARISRFIFDQDCSMAEATAIEEPNEFNSRLDKLVSSVTSTFVKTRIDEVAEPEAWSSRAIALDGASVLADKIASRLPMELALKQTLLETLNPEERLEKLLSFLNAVDVQEGTGKIEDLGAARKRYADSIRKEARLRSERLVRALEEVPREHYLGRGPWKILWPSNLGEYITTRDDNPVRVYKNVLVALDPVRLLNNGLPSVVSSWIDALDLDKGERVVHAGCGTGYYTALMAHIVGQRGRVTAIEIDRELSAQARRNLAQLPWVEVICGDACTYDTGEADAILINAGATHPLALWLDSLRLGGRLVFPMTRSPATTVPIGFGMTMRVHRLRSSYEARLLSPVGVYACAGASDAESDLLLGKALDAGSLTGIRSLRRDLHDAEESCVLHAKGYCFSTRTVS